MGRIGRSLCFLVVSPLIVAGCVRQPPQAAPPEPPEVIVSNPIKRVVADFTEFTGVTAAVETVQIRARVKGFLNAVYFAKPEEVPEKDNRRKLVEGGPVKKNDLLYLIEPDSYRADVESAKGDVLRLQAQVAQTKSESDRAERLRRNNSIADEELIQKQAARDEAIGSLRKAQAALKNAELQLSYTEIRAPIDGIIGRTLVTEGNLVGAGEQTLLTTIVRYEPMYVYFNASERGMLEYERLIADKQADSAVDQTVKVYAGLENEKGHPHEGVIDFRDNQVNAQTGTIEIRGVFKNVQRLMTPGLFTRVKVPIGREKPRLLVPEAALVANSKGRAVLVVDDQGVVQAHQVEVGELQDDGMIVVIDGVTEKDQVIVNGLLRARPGSKVKAKLLAPPAPQSPTK